MFAPSFNEDDLPPLEAALIGSLWSGLVRFRLLVIPHGRGSAEAPCGSSLFPQPLHVFDMQRDGVLDIVEIMHLTILDHRAGLA